MEAEARALRASSSPRQWRSAACSSVKVPTMLVSMKAAGPSIERSTWLSAARCMTTSGSKVGEDRPHPRAVADIGLLETDSARLPATGASEARLPA